MLPVLKILKGPENSPGGLCTEVDSSKNLANFSRSIHQNFLVIITNTIKFISLHIQQKSLIRVENSLHIGRYDWGMTRDAQDTRVSRVTHPFPQQQNLVFLSGINFDVKLFIQKSIIPDAVSTSKAVCTVARGLTH